MTGLRYKDLALLGAIKDSGANLDASRHVLHYLYFRSGAAAQKASEACQAQGWACTVHDPLPEFPGQWSVVAEQASAVLTLEYVRSNTDFFEAVADLYDGDHDGWEVGPDLPAKSTRGACWGLRTLGAGTAASCLSAAGAVTPRRQSRPCRGRRGLVPTWVADLSPAVPSDRTRARRPSGREPTSGRRS